MQLDLFTTPVEPVPAPVEPVPAPGEPGLGPAAPGDALVTEPATLENLAVGDRVISETRWKGQVGVVVELVDRPNCDRVVKVQYQIGPAYPHCLEYLRKVLHGADSAISKLEKA